MPSTSPTIAVAGATGAVGREMLAILEQRNFPHAAIKALASPRSAGQKLPYRNGQLTVEPLTHDSLKGVNIALFSAGSSISKEFCPQAVEHGCIIVDNSSAYRMTDGVPLTIPEVNPDSLSNLRRSVPPSLRRFPEGIIANPNCSTIILLMALTPLRRAFGVERAIVSTYQAASGAGAKGMDELEAQTRDDLAGKEVRPGIPSGETGGGVFHEPYAFNLFSHNTAVDPITGLNVEESKVILETRKIWNDPTVALSATCIRVPVRRAHAESVNVTLKSPATTQQVRDALARFPGVQVIDDRANNLFPTPLKASGKDDVLVGRIRPCSAFPSPFPSPALVGGAGEGGRGSARPGEGAERPINYDAPFSVFDLFICGDQLRKGAALNAVQIAELLL